eukprot:jgi/Chrpa1/26695/Chrysochromulina_OHIO_Genome00003028-RA
MQQKIASPSAETQQHGASGLQQSAQGPRKCLTCSGVPHPEMVRRKSALIIQSGFAGESGFAGA